MFDPAALGTLIIGLEAVRAETHDARPRPTPAAPRRALSIRWGLARGLRRAAAMLEPRPVGEPPAWAQDGAAGSGA